MKIIIRLLVVLNFCMLLGCSNNTSPKLDERQDLSYEKFKNEIIKIGGQKDFEKMTLNQVDSLNCTIVSYEEFIELYKLCKSDKILHPDQNGDLISRGGPVSKGSLNYEIIGLNTLLISVPNVDVPDIFASIIDSRSFRFNLMWTPTTFSNREAFASDCYRKNRAGAEMPFTFYAFEARYDTFVDLLSLLPSLPMNLKGRVHAVKAINTQGESKVLYVFIHIKTDINTGYPSSSAAFEYYFNILM